MLLLKDAVYFAIAGESDFPPKQPVDSLTSMTLRNNSFTTHGS